ncbi:MAG: hypothetical protein FJ221_07810 [Lentisphaerae bacterium]|nr:hypothetical protein [Lentisphaerota bacterium]
MNAETNKTDYAVSIAKGIIGAAPIVGPLVAEIIGNIIPNQRIDRLTKYVQDLNAAVADLDRASMETKMLEPAFVDLLEDSFLAAARALTEERRQQIASLVKNSLANQEIAAAQAKLLLQLLGELSDPEIIVLQFYAKITSPDRDAYLEKHKDIIQGSHAYLGSSQEELDQAALDSTRKAHLERLELIRPNFRSPRRGELPEFDDKTGMMKVSYHSITWLGRLLLRFIDLDDGMEKNDDRTTPPTVQ